MKTNRKLLGAMLVVSVLLGSADAFAQGRGNAYGHDKHNKKERDHHKKRDYDHHDYRDNRHDHHRYDHYSSRQWHGNTHDRFNHRHVYHSPPHWAPAYGYRSNIRYVYYRDYDVYFDCHRGVYITFSGRNWIYSQQVPVHMRHVNFSRIAYIDLDYFDDDLPRYLDGRRSGGYVNIHARF